MHATSFTWRSLKSLHGLLSKRENTIRPSAAKQVEKLPPQRRACTERSLTSRSRIQKSRQKMLSKPTIIREVADLPQPDGTTNSTKKLFPASRLIPCTAELIPQALATLPGLFEFARVCSRCHSFEIGVSVTAFREDRVPT